MRDAIDTYTRLVEYQVGDVTAAATYYIAEIYYEFSVALINSERPDNLNAEELEQYELVIEDQAYPFEEKAINVHEKNMELLDVGVYNEWIDRSIAKLAKLVPARYGKSEQDSLVVAMIQPSQTGNDKAKQNDNNKTGNAEDTDNRVNQHEELPQSQQEAEPQGDAQEKVQENAIKQETAAAWATEQAQTVE